MSEFTGRVPARDQRRRAPGVHVIQDLFPVVSVSRGTKDPDLFESRRHDIFGPLPYSWFIHPMFTYYRPGVDFNTLVAPRLTTVLRWCTVRRWRGDR